MGGERGVARVLHQSGDSSEAEGGIAGQAERKAGPEERTAQSSRGSNRPRTYWKCEASGGRIPAAVAGADGNSAGGDCDGPRIGPGRARGAAGGSNQTGRRANRAGVQAGQIDPGRNCRANRFDSLRRVSAGKAGETEGAAGQWTVNRGQGSVVSGQGGSDERKRK